MGDVSNYRVELAPEQWRSQLQPLGAITCLLSSPYRK